MPRKLHDLMRALERAGFRRRPGKGSHCKFIHPDGRKIVLSGKKGDDALPYQEKQVRNLTDT